jgi:hypothetical protein
LRIIWHKILLDIWGWNLTWFSEHLLNPGARRVTQVAIHGASVQANSDIANV